MHPNVRSSHPELFCEKGVLKNFTKFTGKHLCQSFLIKLQTSGNFIKKEALVQVFSYEFCEIFMNTFFIEHIQRLLVEGARKIAPEENWSRSGLGFGLALVLELGLRWGARAIFLEPFLNMFSFGLSSVRFWLSLRFSLLTLSMYLFAEKDVQ